MLKNWTKLRVFHIDRMYSATSTGLIQFCSKKTLIVQFFNILSINLLSIWLSELWSNCWENSERNSEWVAQVYWGVNYEQIMKELWGFFQWITNWRVLSEQFLIYPVIKIVIQVMGELWINLWFTHWVMCGQILGKLWKNSKGFSKTCPLGMLPSFLEQFLNLPSNQLKSKWWANCKITPKFTDWVCVGKLIKTLKKLNLPPR